MKIIILLFSLLALSSCAHSGRDYDAENRRAQDRAQEAIDACWAISLEDRNSGVTSRMRQGTLESALCMKEHIIYLSENVLFKDQPEVQSEVKDSLENIKKGTGRLYWHLHNSHEYCGLSPCGTMYTMFHNSQFAEQMENIIYDFYQKISYYNQHYNVFELK